MLIKMSLAALAALALGVTVAASASAAGFLASKAEKLLAEKVSTQVFKTDAGNVECTTVNILTGTTSTTETATQLAVVDYEKCKAFSFIEVEISSAHYTFEANGSVRIDKLIKIFVKANGCEISVPAQATSKVDYATKGNNILIEPLVTGIQYKQNSSCTGGAGTLANGTYKGQLEVMIPSGTVSFMEAGGLAWKVEGKILASGESKKIAESLSVTKAMKTTAGGNSIECAELSDKAGAITGFEGGEVENLTFSKCTVTSAPTQCEVVGGSIKTKPLKIVLGGLNSVEFTPKEGGQFMTVEVKSKEGSTCTTAGTFTLSGDIVGTMPNGTTEMSSHTLEFTETSGSDLTEDKDPAFLLVAGLALVGVLIFASVAR